MWPRPSILLTLIGAGVLYVLTRKRAAAVDAAAPGATDAGDFLEEIIVTAKRIGSTVAQLATPRGIRNHNPGNIEWIENARARWRGMIAADGRYGIFDTTANGIRAIGGELRASFKKGQYTVRQIINEWAPPIENNTSAYVDAVAREINVAPDQPIGPAWVPALAAAIIRHENGQQPYALADIAAWVNA